MTHKGPSSPLDHKRHLPWRAFNASDPQRPLKPTQDPPGLKGKSTYICLHYFWPTKVFKAHAGLIILSPKDIGPTWAFNTSGPQRASQTAKASVFVTQNNILLEWLLSYSYPHSNLDQKWSCIAKRNESHISWVTIFEMLVLFKKKKTKKKSKEEKISMIK